MKVRNMPEEVVSRLPEIGSCYWRAVEKLRARRQRIAADLRELEMMREDLLAEVRDDYTDAEIEAADVMVTRCGGVK